MHPYTGSALRSSWRSRWFEISLVAAEGPGRWIDRLTGWCWGILGGAIALYCAMKLLNAILPTLIVVVGVLAILGLAVSVGFVVFRTWRNRW